jgi:hypothetical protein
MPLHTSHQRFLNYRSGAINTIQIVRSVAVKRARMRILCHLLAIVFVMCGSLLAAELSNWARAEAEPGFLLKSERYPTYAIQSSSNLIEWNTVQLSFGPATNRPIQFRSLSASPAFFRAARIDSPTFGYALVAKETISAEETLFDSFDSSDAVYSTDGRYDPFKRRDRAFVASLSSSNAAIQASTATILGNAAAGPGGGLIGTVGDAEWCLATTGIQPGHVANDFDLGFLDVALPSPWKPQFSATSGIVSGVLYAGILTENDYQFGDVSLASTAGIYVAGNVRVYFAGNLRMSASAGITLAPGARLEIYAGGLVDLVAIGINNSGLASNCTVYGLSNCLSIRYIAPSLVGRIYAPHARLHLQGVDAQGAFAARSVHCAGAQIHYDEALRHPTHVLR